MNVFGMTYLDDRKGIAVLSRFGSGTLLDEQHSIIPLDENGWAGPLVPGGDYFFRCTASYILKAHLMVVGSVGVDVTKVETAPSPLHDTLHLITLTKELVIFYQQQQGGGMSAYTQIYC